MLRILSDLHLAHPASLLQDMRQIEPLLEGARRVVFNGDTVELRSATVRPRSLVYLKDIRHFCRARGIEPLVINGNHDPDASDLDHLDLMGGRLLVTHGHVFFPAITPWGRDAKRFRENHAQALRELSLNGEAHLEDRLAAVRHACLMTPSEGGRPPRTGPQWLLAALSEMSHPVRAWEVLRAWIACPGLVAAFAGEHRPRVQCVVMGHTHFPGCWRRGERLVINTGAYLPWLGRQLVDVFETSLVVRAVERDGGVFRPGKELLRWSPQPDAIPVAEPQPAPR